MLPESVYPPLEDSLLLASVVAQHAKGKVLDVGCGSGIQSRTALAKKGTTIVGIDINPVAVKYCKETISSGTFIVSDLFKKVPRKDFDTIIFNPPYLPADEFPHDDATIGGKHGWETIARFLEGAPDYLASEGMILLLFTSRTDKEKVHQLIDNALLEWRMLATNHVAFETYYVYGLTKNPARIDAEKRGVTAIQYFTHGKRGLLFKGKLRGKEVVLKINNPRSTATGRMENEARMLALLNKKGIGPRLIFSTGNVVCYAFAKGPLFGASLPTLSKAVTVRILRTVLRQCFVLDSIGIQKEEMQHPPKHIVCGKKVVLLDFERGHHTEQPHNVTQFCQYITSQAPELAKKGIKIDVQAMRTAAQAYSAAAGKKTFTPILAILDR